MFSGEIKQHPVSGTIQESFVLDVVTGGKTKSSSA
jgi:hypothetical protein